MPLPTEEEILHRFETLDLGRERAQAIENSKDTFRAQAKYILANSYPSREQSLALTALEEAKYWMNQGIALHGSSTWDDQDAPEPARPAGRPIRDEPQA